MKANWFVERAVSLDDDLDPFAAPIEEVGERIDLTDPTAKLQLRLTELLNREGRLCEAGVTCKIKDRADTTCHACSLSQAHDPTQAIYALCRLGREQETVLTELAVVQWRE